MFEGGYLIHQGNSMKHSAMEPSGLYLVHSRPITKSNPASQTTYAYGGNELLSPAKYAQEIYDAFKRKTAATNPNMDMAEFLRCMNELLRTGELEKNYLASGGSYNAQYRKDVMKELQMLITTEKARLEAKYRSNRSAPNSANSGKYEVKRRMGR